jgi:hypothetical protein
MKKYPWRMEEKNDACLFKRKSIFIQKMEANAARGISQSGDQNV